MPAKRNKKQRIKRRERIKKRQILIYTHKGLVKGEERSSNKGLMEKKTSKPENN